MPKTKRVKAYVFTVNCKRNDEYEQQLASRGFAHEYHGFDFFVPLEVGLSTATSFITRCLAKYGYQLHSLFAGEVDRIEEHNTRTLERIEESISKGYHR